MGRWTAVFGKMRTAGSRRIDRREAERLLSGGPVHPDRTGLTELLDLVAAPARPDELAGRQEAVAAFLRIRHQTPAAPARHGRRRLVSTLSRAAAVKLIAGLVVVLAGGTALAAGTGHLPSVIQHGAHELLSPFGVPVPDATSASPSATRHGAGTPSSPPRPGPGAVASPTDPVAVSLCQTWAEQRRKNGKIPNTPEMRVLADAAGGEDKIPTYCAPVLDQTQANSSPIPTDSGHPGGPQPKPSHPGPDKSKVRPSHR
jgi:hypothetical protein